MLMLLFAFGLLLITFSASTYAQSVPLALFVIMFLGVGQAGFFPLINAVLVEKAHDTMRGPRPGCAGPGQGNDHRRGSRRRLPRGSYGRADGPDSLWRGADSHCHCHVLLPRPAPHTIAAAPRCRNDAPSLKCYHLCQRTRAQR